ncbi:MAG: terminase family protein, partial [Evtepia sp.]
SAGGGKSWALLAEPLRHIYNPAFRCVIFRRTMSQIMNSGGLYDASQQLYRLIPGAESRKSPRPHWIFPSGAIIYFAHLQLRDSVYDWQGTEIALIEFDELTHFEESQFWYMLSRNRSTCGIRPYVRCSTNPDPDSFVRKLMRWWINPNTGYAIPERSGIIRYMARLNGEVQWAGSRAELIQMGAENTEIKSFTFIMSSVYDNLELLKQNPEYISNLKALPTVEQERLLNGNWKITPAAGLYFKRSRVNLIEELPDDVVK